MGIASVAVWATPTAVVGAWAGSAVRGLWHRRQQSKARDDRLADVLGKIHLAVVGQDGDEFGPARPGLIEQVSELARQVAVLGEQTANNARQLEHHEVWHQRQEDQRWPRQNIQASPAPRPTSPSSST